MVMNKYMKPTLKQAKKWKEEEESKMKTFRIGIWEEQGGYITIKAKDEKQARKIVNEKLNENGVNSFSDFDITHRDTSITDLDEA